jgi:hypothetical protein
VNDPPEEPPDLEPARVLRDRPQFLDRFRERVVETPEIPVPEPLQLDLIIEVEPPDQREEPERPIAEREARKLLGGGEK